VKKRIQRAEILLEANFALDVVMMKYVGINPVIVHGGGPQIGKTLDALGIKSEFVGGLRVTDKETVDVVEMVLGGKVNKEIVSLINRHGGNAVGITGKDGGLIRAKRYRKVRKSAETNRPEIIDLGLVGDITGVNPKILEVLDNHEFIPVIAPVGLGENDETLNINADFVASHIAAALKAEKLVLMTDTEGVKDKNNKLISELTRKKAQSLIKSGVIRDGMLPKVNCGLDALKAGVHKAHIIDGRVKHAVLLEILTEKGVGTQIIEK
jgi:acetylglutamate kinase